MNKILLKILGICIITSLLLPTTIGLKCDSDDDTDILTNSYIAILINRINNDGHLIFNVSNLGIEEVNNATILIHFYGSSPFFNLNNVDINTEISIQNLSSGESELLKTKDQVFKVRPLFRRPLVFFFFGIMDMIYNGYSRTAFIRKLLSLIETEMIIFPYP